MAVTEPAANLGHNSGMAERVIPLVDQRLAVRQPFFSAQPVAPGSLLSDARGRALHDLRISVTDRCNFRCSYCMPKEVFNSHYPYLPHGDLLTFEEITRVARQFVGLGVRKIRLTGGEPLVRKGIMELVENLSDLTLLVEPLLLVRRVVREQIGVLQRARETVAREAVGKAVGFSNRIFKFIKRSHHGDRTERLFVHQPA